MSTGDTPSLTKVISDSIESRLSEVHVAMPGEIVSYDDATGLASVRPSLQRRYLETDKLVDLPVINNVPIMHPRGGGALIKFAMIKGDPVTLIFSERSLDRWITTGGKVDPQDTRKHALSDAFAYPGGYPKSKPQTDATITAAFSATGLKISNATGNFWFKDNADVTFDTGTVQGRFGAGGKVEFQNAVGKLIDALYTILTTANAGGFPLIVNPTALATLASFKEA